MERVAAPLRELGAHVETTDGHAPLVVEGGKLRGITYELPVASAQVKSAVLLAGLYAKGRTTVVEPAATRDHTELLLQHAGVDVERKGLSVSVTGVERLELDRVEVPGDFSSAAPLIVAATLLPGSELYLHGVGINPTRTGLLDVLERMRARVTLFNKRKLGAETVADIDVRSPRRSSRRASLPPRCRAWSTSSRSSRSSPGLARGETVIRGVQELRVKETDRVETVKDLLKPLGIRVSAGEDELRVVGVPTRPKGGGSADSQGDHRIAMLGAVAGLVSREGLRLEGADAAAVSFPGFFELLESIALR